MTTLLRLLDSHVFLGIPGNAVWDLVKLAWEKVNDKSWEELYFAAFQAAADRMRPSLARYADGDISLDEETLRRALNQDLIVAIDVSSVSDLTDKEFTRRLAAALCERQALVIGGHNLSEFDYAQLTRNVTEHATALFKQSVLDNEPAFRKAVLEEVADNHALIHDTYRYLSIQFDIVLTELEGIHKDLLLLKQHLGLDRSQETIVQELKVNLDAAPRGPMFESGGLCDGYLLQPMPEQYFVAQEFKPDREDLRGALAEALAAFGVQPVCADDLYWPGSILCKICALIQGTPFGVYQLTVGQNRNVYLELGIAIGLGRPCVLVKEKEAEVASLVRGLEYYPVDSYLQLRHEFGAKVDSFIADIARHRPQSLPPVGSERTVIVAHGDMDVVDFSVTVSKMITEYDLKPVILGDPTGKLARYLEMEGVSHHIVGSGGRMRLDETVSAIRAARMGVYRVESEASPDTFLALGVSIGLNQPGLFLHGTNAVPPSDLRGLGALSYGGYAGNEGLEASFPRWFEHLVHKYG